MATERITLEVKNLLTPKKAAAQLTITTMTLWRWTQAGKIQAFVIDGHNYYLQTEITRLKQITKH